MDPNAISGQISQLDQSYNPTDVYNKVTTQLGIPDARTRVQALQKNLVDTQNAIEAIPGSVQGRTQNALVTDAQRARLVNMEQTPLNTNYSKQNQSYGIEQSNLAQSETEADRQVTAAREEYQNRRQSLLTQLDTALKQQAAAEAIREFNVSQANARAAAAAGGGGGGSRGGGGGGSAAKGPSYQQRSGGGYNFQDASGKAISARLYAQLTGTNFNTLLRTMAANGDSGAADVLKNGGSSAAYHALTWD